MKYGETFTDIHNAIDWEKQLKGWSRKKKEALFIDDWEEIKRLIEAYTHPENKNSSKLLEKYNFKKQESIDSNSNGMFVIFKLSPILAQASEKSLPLAQGCSNGFCAAAILVPLYFHYSAFC